MAYSKQTWYDGSSGGTPITAARLNTMEDGIVGAYLLSNMSGTLPINRGGTGATTASAARNALGLGNTTGALPIANGGTGATTTAAARNALGLGNTTGALPTANGGTGATTASAARTNLGITPANIGAAASSHTHGAGDIASGKLAIARGGTNACTAADARTNLGITPANIGATSTAKLLATFTTGTTYSNVSAQTISELSDYNLFLVSCKCQRNNDTTWYHKTIPCYAWTTNAMTFPLTFEFVDTGYYKTIHQRNITINKGTNKVTFSSGWDGYNNTVDNTKVIPLYLNGIAIK